MESDCGRLTPNDVDSRRTVARLHSESLADSMVSVLGSKVVARYYEFLVGSELEAVFVCRRQGRVVGAAVLSEDPDTLSRRFLSNGSPVLLWHAVVGAARSPAVARRLVLSMREPKPLGALEGLPEVVQLFVDPAVRGLGAGREVLGEVESHLRGSARRAYFVKTLAAADNRALDFYNRLGFVAVGEQSLQGFRFRFLSKQLP